MSRILAIDMGKNKSVFCDYDPGDGTHRFGKVLTSPKDFHDLLVEQAPRRVIIEISPLAGWVSDLCVALKIELKVVNTASAAWSWKRVKDKSDRGDALKIATMEAMGQHRYVHVPAAAVRQWRELIGYRDDLVGRVTASKNRLRALLDRQGERWPAGKKGWTAEALETLGSMARALGECPAEQLWRGMLQEELSCLEQARGHLLTVTAKLDALAEKSVRVSRLKTVSGVGNRTAEIVIAMLDDPQRFKNVRQVGAYTGLTARRMQSGQMDRQLGISYAGSRLLRKMLVQAAWVGQRTNPWLAETYERICAGKTQRRKKAIVATSRKLFIRLWAMDRDQKDWNGPAAVRPRAKQTQTIKREDWGAAPSPAS